MVDGQRPSLAVHLLLLSIAAFCLELCGDVRTAAAQEPSPVSLEALSAAIDQLGILDYETRTEASRTVRRSDPSLAVPALLEAVAEHPDGYVKYRALVLLIGFNDPRTQGAMREAMESPNDRLRIVAYSYFAHNPSPDLAEDLLARLETELAEFVRPALVRALAAHGESLDIQQALIRDAGRGEDFFRSAVIEALGDYRAAYAFDALTEIAKLDGPLQDDAALALGRLSDKRAVATLAELQTTAPRAAQPIVAASICLLGVNCGSHEPFVIESLRFADKNPGFQEILRNAATALGALGLAGRATAVEALFRTGIPSRDPTRAPVALALATVALRNPPVLLDTLDKEPDRVAALDLLAEGFDMLAEDYEKERFFMFVRRSYWAAADGSSTRDLMQTLIDRLDF
jgi:HEAT repeat protein